MIAPAAANGSLRTVGPTPPEAPLAMPSQQLHIAPAARFGAPGLRVVGARLTAFGGAAALTYFGADQMLRAFGPDAVSGLQIALQVLFAITFGWISFAATSALAGLLFPPLRRRTTPDGPLSTHTAIVMPVYHEDAPTTVGALAAIGAGLVRLGHGHAFELFMLSDTRDPDAIVQETTAFAGLRDELGAGIAAWYRRRGRNEGSKAGNVRDFVERWGASYDHMLVLDADSLMAPETIVEMVRRMQDDARLGLLQTTPAFLGGATAFARLQQFAGSLYGPVVARGVAAWQGMDGNFWGHNALIRVSAFAGAAGLPELPGRKPFGGHILSHDFVEAALLRRAGWSVRMDPDLGGSWEGAPPSLLAASVRDRRWAQGNFQHARLLGAAGLRWPNRVHFAIGIGSYLMSPVWLAMLAVGIVLTARAAIALPDYFPESFQLFPVWPRFDPARMTTLFVVSMLLLLSPKLLGLAEALLDGDRRRRLGGARSVVGSGLVELVMSTLLAPAQMLMQCRHVVEILLGRDGGWKAQAREGAALPWPDAWRAHWGHSASGLAIAVLVYRIQPEVLVWLTPVLAGGILAPLLSRWTGERRTGERLRAAGLLCTPEERAVPEIAVAASAAAARVATCTAGGILDLQRDADLAARHLALLEPAGPAPDQAAMLAHLTARAKLRQAASAAEALAWLEPPERLALVGNRDLLELWRCKPDANSTALAAGRDTAGHSDERPTAAACTQGLERAAFAS